nr:leucine-rich repeat domain-containing protein [Lachnospiraceae bacterium]
MSGTNGYGNGGNGYGNLSDEEKLRMLHDRRDEQRRKEEAARRAAAARRRIEGSARGRAAADTDSSYGTGRGQGSSYNRGSARTGSYSGGYGSGASSGRRYPEHRGLRDEEEREEAYSASDRSASHSGAKTRRTDRTASGRGEKVTAGAGASKGASKTGKKRAFSGIRNPLNKLPVNIRKTIRLTTAGVLAVSAIVVAAIPGNSLRAADELPELQEYIEKSSYEYTVSDNRSGSGKKETRFEDKNGNIIETCDSSFGSGEYYTPVNDSNLSLYHQNPSGVDVQRSYKITSSSSSGKTTYTNTYQFDYYMTSVSGQNNVGVICGYNSKTLTGGVTIDKNNFPTEYIDVDDYTSVEAAVSDSTVSYTYNYDNWASDGYKSSDTDLSAFDATASANFLYRYYHDNYVNAIAEYESSEYYQYDQAEDKSAWTEPPTKPTNSIVGTVAGISGSEYRYNWYLDYTQNSPYGQGMTYIPTVKYDDTHDGNTVLTAYCPSEADGYWFAPHGSAGNLKPGYGLDTDNNFIYDSDPQVMIAAIGDYAFAGMTSIDGLQLEGILYIGDYAFAGSTVLKSVDLTNVQHIGNGAFYSCPMLATVFSSDTENTQGSQVAVIGAQAFYNCSALTAFEYPTMLQTIGAGAFAYCSNLQAANFNATQNTVTIGDYAFFNDYSMSSLSFFGENSTGTQTTDSTHHWNIGTGAFAMAMDETSSDNLSTIYFPANIDNLNNGSDWLVAGRTNLKYVHMPANFGSGDVRLPVSTFIDCSGLEFVRFPEGTGKVCMNPYTFYDVTNSNFYVEGPANRDDSNIAYQREDTWASRDHSGRSIPYKIVDTETYEAVSTENDNLIIQYEGISDQNAALTLVFQRTTHSSKGSVPHSYTATSDPDMTLAIPETVASYLITKIGNGTDCVIDQSMLNDSNKVTRIKVPYTVTEVSDNAFKDTRYVTQIDFEYGGHDVAVGEDAFYIGDSATGLLINGKIDADYGPFAYAAAGNTMNKANTPTHICYRGNTSSDIGLVTIYDKDKSVMTLVDYPKTFELDREYAEEMADSWYDYYEERNSKTERDRFMSNYLLGYDENGNLASVSKCVYDYTVDNESGPYGPWISDSFCDDFAIEVASYINDNYENWASQWAGSGTMPELKDLLNTVASSISTTPPKPYFEQHP